MNFCTHIVSGWCLGFTIGGMFGDPFTGGFIGAFGSLWPDIDHPGSFIGRRFEITSAIVSRHTRHRGIMHSLLLCLISSFLIGGLLGYSLHKFWMSIAAFFGGTFVHLLTDSCTVSGIAWFAPFSQKRLQGIIKTNSFEEGLVFIFLLLYAIGLLILYGYMNL